MAAKEAEEGVVSVEVVELEMVEVEVEVGKTP
eukprot:CAMPEP_0181210076 /NCGR_PEP_ID=MMETSP1096-20121128/23029_1 /TAXON_ID=156174 ORGANISM="Chrysochromulina ericina, Strain CCMP281" /NCGR_SAMPLE_ID=MMETSP1096 /ASSEMBLY_ACC=CAM_ASM_000453 /LENGTH=31 /DNA_ID= /DNA_START= /DNA_END= /DNA_ORIENTATION=